jgi:nucleoside-diphosphate-sugar epimerase
MKIVITGDKGLIGFYLRKRLEHEGHEIIMSCDLRSGGNILDLKDKILNEKADMMIHLAAHCKINQAVKNPENSHINDADGTFAVMEFCRKNNIPKVVYFSSSRVLSSEKNPYTAAKLYGEELCKGYRYSYGIDYLIIRPSTVYGPFWDLTRRLVHIFITNALDGKDLEIYGNPETKTLDFTYIDDFVDGTMLAINSSKWNEEYNISGGVYNIRDLAEFIVKETGSSSRVVIKGAEIAQPQQVSLDLSVIKGLGYQPSVSVEEGIRKCVDWYKRQFVSQ